MQTKNLYLCLRTKVLKLLDSTCVTSDHWSIAELCFWGKTQCKQMTRCHLLNIFNLPNLLWIAREFPFGKETLLHFLSLSLISRKMQTSSVSADKMNRIHDIKLKGHRYCWLLPAGYNRLVLFNMKQVGRCSRTVSHLGVEDSVRCNEPSLQ